MRSRLRHAPRHASPAFKFNVWIARGARGARARAPVAEYGAAYMPAAEELPSVRSFVRSAAVCLFKVVR